MGNRSSTIRTVATRLFRPELQSKIPANRQLGSYATRYRRDPRHIAAARGYPFVVGPEQRSSISPVSQNGHVFSGKTDQYTTRVQPVTHW